MGGLIGWAVVRGTRVLGLVLSLDPYFAVRDLYYWIISRRMGSLDPARLEET